MMMAPAATPLSITMGFPNSGGASLRGLEGMAGRDDADVRPDHHIVRDIEVAQVIKSTVLVDEDVTPDTDFVAVGRKK